MSKQLVILVMWLVATTAMAEVPTFQTGQVLTATQLNNAFKQTLPISGGTMTGKLVTPSAEINNATIITGTIGSLTSPLPINSGGTGATTAKDAVKSLQYQANNGQSRSVQDKLADNVNVLDFGADTTGTKDSATAFTNAITMAGEGGTVTIPKGNYLLSSNPYQTLSKSMQFNISPNAKFTGNGASGLTGFNHPYTNGYNSTAGAWQLWKDLPDPQNTADTTNGWTQELLGNATGAKSQVIGFMGADSNFNHTDGNIQEVLNLVQNVHDADLIGTGIYKPFEIDLDVDVSKPGAKVANNGNGLIGMLLTGGGAGQPYQGSGMLGVVVQRSTGKWGKAYVVQNSDVGMELNTYKMPINIQTTYYGNFNDPDCDNKTYPGGCLIQSGIVYSNANSYLGTLFAGKQLANGNDTVKLFRNSDTSSSGSMLKVRNAGDNYDVFNLSTGGNIQTQGSILSSWNGGGVGYSAGAGANVIQSGSKSTDVTINALTGRVTLNNASLASNAVVCFGMNNNTLQNTDSMIVSLAGGNTSGAYMLNVDSITNGYAKICLNNRSQSSLSESVVFNYATIRGASN